MEATSYKTFTVCDDTHYHYTVEPEDCGIQIIYHESGSEMSRVGMSPAAARLIAKALIELADEEENRK